MSGFKILFSDIDEKMWEMKEQMEELISSCDSYNEKLDALINLSSFKGSSADAIKSYMSEVHKTIITSIKTAAQELKDQLVIYKSGYEGLGEYASYALPQETIEEAQRRYSAAYEDTCDQTDIIKNALNDISDIYSAEMPSMLMVTTEHEDLDKDLKDFVFKIEDHESKTKSINLMRLDILLTELNECLVNCTDKDFSRVSEYETGSFVNQESTQGLVNTVNLCYTFHETNAEQLEAMWEQEANIREQLEEQRETQGIWQTVGAVTLIVVGTVCIVCTAGMATPLVVAGTAAGVGTIGFGVSEAVEGGQNIYYGANGDLNTAAFNPLRDTVFQGNQQVYDNTKNAFAFAASTMIPIGQAYKAGKLTLRSGAVIAGEEVFGEATGQLTDYVGEKLELDPVSKMILGMSVSMASSAGMSKLDRTFNLSGNFPKGTIDTNIKSGDISESIKVGEYDTSPEHSFKFEIKNADDLINLGIDNPSDLSKIGINSADELFKSGITNVENIEKLGYKLSRKQKGNLGEIMMDRYFEEQGFKTLTEKLSSLDDPIHHGIDGVYYKPGPPPEYIISESKYTANGKGSLSVLTDGTKQMSNEWINDRLEDALGDNYEQYLQDIVQYPDCTKCKLFNIDMNSCVKINNIIDGVIIN